MPAVWSTASEDIYSWSPCRGSDRRYWQLRTIAVLYYWAVVSSPRTCTWSDVHAARSAPDNSRGDKRPPRRCRLSEDCIPLMDPLKGVIFDLLSSLAPRPLRCAAWTESVGPDVRTTSQDEQGAWWATRAAERWLHGACCCTGCHISRYNVWGVQVAAFLRPGAQGSLGWEDLGLRLAHVQHLHDE
jgi:hypothetical protein